MEVYRDEGYTGEILERPGLQAALAAAKSAAFFIVYDPDRLSRRLAHQLLLVEAIEKAGCRLEFVTLDWQANPEGRLFYFTRRHRRIRKREVQTAQPVRPPGQS